MCMRAICRGAKYKSRPTRKSGTPAHWPKSGCVCPGRSALRDCHDPRGRYWDDIEDCLSNSQCAPLPDRLAAKRRTVHPIREIGETDSGLRGGALSIVFGRIRLAEWESASEGLEARQRLLGSTLFTARKGVAAQPALGAPVCTETCQTGRGIRVHGLKWISESSGDCLCDCQ